MSDATDNWKSLQLFSGEEHGVILADYSCRVRQSQSARSLWQSVDIVFKLKTGASVPKGERKVAVDAPVLQVGNKPSTSLLSSTSFASLDAFHFLLECLDATDNLGNVRVAKAIVPLVEGHIARSDVVSLRLWDSEYVEKVVSFAGPLESYKGLAVPESDIYDLPTLFAAAAAGLLLRISPVTENEDAIEALSHASESELENRLSFPWMLPGLIQEKTLVLVDANISHAGELGTGSGLYHAAKKLGIKLVVLDNAGSLLQEPEHTHWCEAFIPTKLTNPPEADCASHILESIKAYGKHVDGIITFADSFWIYICEAAEKLGLQTSSQEAYRIATNKYLTSKYEGHEAFRASSLEEALEVATKNKLPYPLIVKPCDGWSSEGVSRVDSFEALTTAVKAIDTSRHGTEFVIEKYCSGPEVDANFVLLDGEVLFFEACDDLPKSADINGPTVGSVTNFHELNSVYPSKLPDEEISLLRDSFLNTLLKLGLRDGIMHLEGRVENSTTDYKSVNGILDLHPVDPSPGAPEKPSAWLIEINPRPLGMTGSQIIESTYGIDYWGLALLIAVGDKARVRALSRPYLHGAQYTCIMVFIPADFSAHLKGIFDSDDICVDLKNRRPDLAKQISRSACLVKRGQKVAHPSSGRNSFLAYFNVFSRNSREEALEFARQVREEVRYSFL
ncbi:unnamed protein product [Clonostachys rosea f. rosea IK726]|uniref:ATP-grasp domain-containing protein n=2 Tax=Bionectria ochroleuca TaxID=29856 RepID=A0A0B7KN78_BIOOC|nr:unnamed protein product [Clonostachys rosea f. rosea IK726]